MTETNQECPLTLSEVTARVKIEIMKTSRFDKLRRLCKELQDAIVAKDAELMARLYDELSEVYMKVFAAEDYSFECLKEYCLSTIVCLQFKAYNNMFGPTIEEGNNTIGMIDSLISLSDYSKDEKDELRLFKAQIKSIITPLKPHKNLVVPRLDCRCTLCRIRPANKTGSHMVPNFLAHPTFSWDGKGNRGREALNHDFLNTPEKNCQFYGNEVPAWRFAMGEGKKDAEDLTDEDIEKNINQVEFDNEFCSVCEKRFGVLESAYAQFYSAPKKKNVDARVAYLFWLSVLWRMSMGSMSIFMNIEDELSLRKLLDENILDSDKAIAESDNDLGEWKYAMFRAEGLKEGDKGIFGYRKECSPYVVMYNDLVMVFYHNDPSDEELEIGPIVVDREQLNDWHSPEKSVVVDRRWFWNVRDWFIETSYDFYDPVREKVLIGIREEERSMDVVVSDYKKEQAIKAARLTAPPKERRLNLRKFYRIYVAWQRLKEAEEKCEKYEPLNDEELFLTEKDFHNYYEDLANLARHMDEEKIEEFPFYEQARKYIPDEAEWTKLEDTTDSDPAYTDAVKGVIANMNARQLNRIFGEQQEPYVNPYAKIGRNDPCPCGSGKKYKKCCGRGL